MIVTVRIPSQLSSLSGGLSQLAVEGMTVGEVLRALDVAFPGFAEYLFNDRGLVRRSVAVSLAGTDITELAGVDTPVDHGQIVAISPNVAPAGESSAWYRGETGAPGMEATRPRLLIVDDEESIRTLLMWAFADAGYDVEAVSGGEQAVDFLEADPPDCMILDLMMPGVDGQMVLVHRRTHHLAPNTRIIVLTAKTGHADEVWCWRHGADEFLTKPFDADQLARLVAQLMALSPKDLAHRREVGLADARRMDAIESAFQLKPIRSAR